MMTLLQNVALFWILVAFTTTKANVELNFIKVLSRNQSVRFAIVDEVYPSVAFDKQAWRKYRMMKNFTEACLNVQRIRSQYTDYYVNMLETQRIEEFRSYMYSKFLEVSCRENDKQNSAKTTRTEVWLFGLLAVTGINAAATTGICFVPVLKKKFFGFIMVFMIALAVGSLAGTSLLILIPDAIRISEMLVVTNFDKNEFKWRITIVFMGIYLFFILERLLKSIIDRHRNKIDCDRTNQNGTCEAVNFDVCKVSHSEKRVAPVAWMIVMGDSLHNFVDGLSIGAAFATDTFTGLSVALAILCEELPHELGDFAVLLDAGMSAKKAILWNLLSACTCYVGFIIGALVGELPTASQWIFALAGGMFLYISLVDMMNSLNTMIDKTGTSKTSKIVTFVTQNIGLWTGYSTILVMSLFGDKIKLGSK